VASLTWIARAAVTVAAAAVLVAIIPIDAVAGALRRMSVWTWAGSLIIFFGGHYLNALKFRLLLGQPSVSSTVCVQAQYAGLVANLGLPGLAGGDLVRAAYLVPTAGATRVVTASVADRLLDTLTLLVLVAVALPIAGAPPVIADGLRAGGRWLAVAAAVGVLLIVIVLLLRRGAALSTRSAGLPPSRDASADRRSLGGGGSAPRLVAAAALSLLVQTVFVLTNVWLARNVGVATGLAVWFVAWPLAKLIAVLPISLGGIGVREAALVSLLAPYGAPREAVLASGILWQAVLIVSGLAGLVVTQGRRVREGRKGTPEP
jgi:uncharacterized membrane protein YbhN (UPF0104 family)